MSSNLDSYAPNVEPTQSGELTADEIDLYVGFAEECIQKVEELEDLILSLEKSPGDLEIPKAVYRILHTVKGTAASIGLEDLARFSHKFEDYIVPIREGTIAANSTHTSVLLTAAEHLTTAMATLKSGHKPTLPGDFWSGTTAVDAETNVVSAPPAENKAAKSAPAAETPKARKISVELDMIDELLARSGNITLIRDLLLQDLEAMAFRFPSESALKRGISYLADMGKENDLLQTHVGNLRRTGVSSALRATQRAVRDLSIQLGKKVKLELTGTNVQVDFDMCQILSDSLVHIVRNSLDHGIEMPEDRVKNGKPAEATIAIAVSQANDELVICTLDDGRGIDAERIKKKALDKNIVTEEKLANMSHEAILGLIFESGFSTAEKVTEVSGRGVGLDMVMRSISAMKGRVQVSSQLKVGTQFTITIPEKKQTNIMSAFVVSCNGQKLAVPRDQVCEIKSIEQLKTHKRLFERERNLFAQYSAKYLNVIAPMTNDISGAVAYTPQSIVMFLDDLSYSSAIIVDEVYSVDKVIVKEFSDSAPQANSFEKAALSGRFGLLLYLDLAVSKKLTTPHHASNEETPSDEH